MSADLAAPGWGEGGNVSVEGRKSPGAEGESEAPRGVRRLASTKCSAGPIGSSNVVVELEAPRGVDLVTPRWGSDGPVRASIVVGKSKAPRGVCLAAPEAEASAVGVVWSSRAGCAKRASLPSCK